MVRVDQGVSEVTEQGRAANDGRTTTVDLVFEGGGVKGIGLVGAYSMLEE